jgi:hypothetical protein
MLSHHLGNFAVAAAAQEGLEDGGHAAADKRCGAEGWVLRGRINGAATLWGRGGRNGCN